MPRNELPTPSWAGVEGLPSWAGETPAVGRGTVPAGVPERDGELGALGDLAGLVPEKGNAGRKLRRLPLLFDDVLEQPKLSPRRTAKVTKADMRCLRLFMVGTVKSGQPKERLVNWLKHANLK